MWPTLPVCCMCALASSTSPSKCQDVTSSPAINCTLGSCNHTPNDKALAQHHHPPHVD